MTRQRWRRGIETKQKSYMKKNRKRKVVLFVLGLTTHSATLKGETCEYVPKTLK